MKQLLGIYMILILGLLLAACNPESIKTIGATKYYVEIDHSGEKYKEQGNTRYKYELAGFNEDGKGKNLTFTANHSLKKDAYLQIDYKKDEVITYEEVKYEDIPKKARKQLDDNHDNS
ncbi:YxeA family protein [Virgibacillus halophilus]